MDNFEYALREFHEAHDLPRPDEPVAYQPEEIRQLRENLIDEEWLELKEALDEGDIEQIAKESTDLLYVVIGLMVTYGVPIEESFYEVHKSNMTKLGEDGKPVRRESDGKVLKGPNYKPADMTDALAWAKKKRETLKEMHREYHKSLN